ncbi:unnamed protein product [Alternaria alternata]
MTVCLRPSPPRREDDKRIEMSELAEVDELYNQKTAQWKRDARTKERRERDQLKAEQVKEGLTERKAEEERQGLVRRLSVSYSKAVFGQVQGFTLSSTEKKAET